MIEATKFVVEPRPFVPALTGPIAGTNPRESPFVRRKAATRVTRIEIKYLTPIDVNDTADVQARLSQEEVVELPSGRTENAVSRLEWAIVLRLDGSGFDWTEHDIPIKQGTPLAVTEHWVPRAKDTGEYVLRFPLRDINHAGTASGYGEPVRDRVEVQG
jgi:hypothetical protein